MHDRERRRLEEGEQGMTLPTVPHHGIGLHGTSLDSQELRSVVPLVDAPGVLDRSPWFAKIQVDLPEDGSLLHPGTLRNINSQLDGRGPVAFTHQGRINVLFAVSDGGHENRVVAEAAAAAIARAVAHGRATRIAATLVCRAQQEPDTSKSSYLSLVKKADTP